MAKTTFTSSDLAILGSSFWLGVLFLMESLLAVLSLVAVVSWFRGNEALGLKVAISGALVSLVALQPLMFYLEQFSAMTSMLLLFAFLLILLAYHRWYSAKDH